MKIDANGKPLPPGWGRKRRTRGMAYRLRRAARRANRYYEIAKTDHSGVYNALWLKWQGYSFYLYRGSHFYRDQMARRKYWKN